MIAAFAALLTLTSAGCATLKTPEGQEAALRIAAVNVARTAMAFSPETRKIVSTVCLTVETGDMVGAKGVLQCLWTDLNDAQAHAIAGLINDLVVLVGGEAADEAAYSKILTAICEAVPKAEGKKKV